jgi:hypothetical protein
MDMTMDGFAGCKDAEKPQAGKVLKYFRMHSKNQPLTKIAAAESGILTH